MLLAQATALAEPGNRRPPRYRDIATDLQDKIADGTYGVGQNLPTEAVLCRTFGVSRHTVREALKRLSNRGLVERRRAVGTLVCARYPEGRYRQALPSTAALLEIPPDLKADVVVRGIVQADLALARLLGCAESREWACLGIVRRAPEGPPVGWTDLYLCPSLLAAEGPGSLAEATAALEQRLMERADTIDVIVESRRLTPKQAEHLAVDPDIAALSLLRRMRDGSGPYCVSITLHPQGRFGFEAQMSRCWQPGERHAE